jgi:hypothetical protein
MVWSYFGLGHGKGVHDGAGIIFKQEIRKEQLNVDGRKLQCATNMVSICEKRQMEEHLAYPNAR